MKTPTKPFEYYVRTIVEYQVDLKLEAGNSFGKGVVKMKAAFGYSLFKRH